jgi:hypothetical protein
MHFVPSHWVGLENFHHLEVLMNGRESNARMTVWGRERSYNKPCQAKDANKPAKRSKHGKESERGI